MSDTHESKASERAAMAVHSKINVHALPVRGFLDQNVAPALLEGLAIIAKERPEDPVDFLGKFLVRRGKFGPALQFHAR
ncbi:Dosage compensation protein dpy-30 [Diplonema papillatum]|nr:Dosage compensation protein dpy-30 [Diplonema papillatum]